MHFRPTIVRNERDVLEDMNPFCRFLLKCGVKAGEKDHTGVEFNARTLNEAQFRNVLRPETIRGDTDQAAELEEAIYSCGAGNWRLGISTKFLLRTCSRFHFAGVPPTTFTNARVNAA
jgi:hypothetical protein